MTMDFEETGCNLCVTAPFSKTNEEERCGSIRIINRRILKGQLHKIYEDFCAYPKKYFPHQ